MQVGPHLCWRTVFQLELLTFLAGSFLQKPETDQEVLVLPKEHWAWNSVSTFPSPTLAGVPLHLLPSLRNRLLQKNHPDR